MRESSGNPRGGSTLRFWSLRMLAGITRRFRPPGTERLVRWVCNPDKSNPAHIRCLARCEGNFLLHVDTSSFLEWSIFFFGRYEPEVLHQIKKHLPTGGVALDVGANVGLLTMVMAQAAGERGRVIAVEPYPGVFRRLSQNLRLNGLERVALYPCALGEKPGRAILHCPAKNAANQGCATFASRTQAPLSEDLEVEVKTLDQVVQREGLARLDLLKIDTEGWDFFVLKGGEKSIGTFRPAILFEYMKPGWTEGGASLKNAVDWLGRFHYRLFAIQGETLRRLESARSDCFNILALPDLLP